MQQCLLLQGNLIHSGVTRGEKLVVLIGQRKALAMAVKNGRTKNRFPGLRQFSLMLRLVFGRLSRPDQQGNCEAN